MAEDLRLSIDAPVELAIGIFAAVSSAIVFISTVISVGHRPELEAFHTRKLVLEHRPDGARLVSDEALQRTFGRSARVLSKLLTGRLKRNVASR